MYTTIMIPNIENIIDCDVGHRCRAAFRQELDSSSCQELENICKVNFDGGDYYYYLYIELTHDIDTVTDSLYFSLEDTVDSYYYD